MALDLVRARRSGPGGIGRRQATRLRSLVDHARARSPYYRRLYAGLPAGPVHLASLPPVGKRDLMGAFDEWVTDPGVTREGVEAFTSDEQLLGTPYLGRYFACRSSGTTGEPGLFVHDPTAVAVYEAMTLRIDLQWLSASQWVALLRGRARWAAVVGTGAHYAGAGWMELQRSRDRVRRRALRVFPVEQPLERLVNGLNTFRPAILTGYPSALQVLAAEQLAGRLSVDPVVVELGGESVDDRGRALIRRGLGGGLHDAYSASECLVMAVDCDRGWLHVNSDWVVLEPVEHDLHVTPPGRASHSVLLTNLANRVQPVIRYDLGDSVLVAPDPCPCGSPFPAIRVQGRNSDVLRLTAPDGRVVTLSALAVGSVLDRSTAVVRSQVVRTGERSLRLRLDLLPWEPPGPAWADATARLTAYLVAQGLGDVTVVRAEEAPQRSVPSGKLRQVLAG